MVIAHYTFSPAYPKWFLSPLSISIDVVEWVHAILLIPDILEVFVFITITITITISCSCYLPCELILIWLEAITVGFGKFLKRHRKLIGWLEHIYFYFLRHHDLILHILDPNLQPKKCIFMRPISPHQALRRYPGYPPC